MATVEARNSRTAERRGRSATPALAARLGGRLPGGLPDAAREWKLVLNPQRSATTPTGRPVTARAIERSRNAGMIALGLRDVLPQRGGGERVEQGTAGGEMVELGQQPLDRGRAPVGGRERRLATTGARVG
jgi:hypothetical protein